ncbi:MAG: aminotransferase class I/II-fold pyridoxal phosphate-dependent enzyme [Proteobacteria bacterium]|nr:aminotransferase class I/II-fold pyridoxal phosphate-dependent enzyme [Pseudomonadota bacterium]
MDILRRANERAAAGGDVLHLEVGQPSTGAPAAVLAAAHEALDGETLGYTEALGLPALRETIARHYRDYYAISVPPGRIAVTTGSSAGFILAFLAAFEPGDRVALAAPGYPAYRNILAALGIEPVELAVGAESRFQPTVADLEAAGPLAGLIVASPANPTGTVLSREALGLIAQHCRANGIRLISDEIYHGIGYGPAITSALVLTHEAVVINSFSKYFSMTGWRIGWMVMPEELVRPVECLAQNLFISPPSLAQLAAVAAFGCRAELDRNVARYAENRAILLQGLPEAGLDSLAPADGAFYVYADVGRFTNDSEAFCRRLLAETGVAITPGVDFDRERGHRLVRLSFAGSTETVARAVDRIGPFLRR